MKKLLAVFLTFSIVLGLCACGGSGNENPEETKAAEGLQIGFAKESIMPDGQVNLAGSGNNAHRVSTGFTDILYATCLAASENGTTILLFSTDTLYAKMEWTSEARKLINKATGVPEANIQIGGTHTHSGPTVGGNLPLTLQWKPIYMDGLVNAAKKALADQAPATLYGTRVETEKMTFVRHYLMTDGSYAGSNFGDYSKGIVDYATEADEEMTLIKIDREGDKKDILLMNFQAHPCFGSGNNALDISADFIGSARDAVEKETDMHFIYFSGATGNQNTLSQIGTHNASYTKDRILYGQELARYAIEALPGMTTAVEGAGVKTTQVQIEYKSNDYGQDRLAEAKEIAQAFGLSGDADQCTTLAKQKGFHSVYECTGIVTCSKLPPTGSFEVNVCSFGGVGFVAAPHEMFNATGRYIKENSPFAFTVISTTTNDYHHYFPTKEAYAYGCYESFTARFASGVAEDMQVKYVELLKEVQ